MTYAAFTYQRCTDSLECGDDCAGWTGWADELPPLGAKPWPTCPCCGGEAQLETPLAPFPVPSSEGRG